jgi:hypothetical protein
MTSARRLGDSDERSLYATFERAASQPPSPLQSYAFPAGRRSANPTVRSPRNFGHAAFLSLALFSNFP